MADEIKLEVMSPENMRDVVSRHWMAVNEDMDQSRRRPFDPSRFAEPYMMETRRHPVHVFRLATQDIKVAFDEKTRTLMIGETDSGGWVRHMADRAEHTGERNPFFHEVSHAYHVADDARASQVKHARVVADAVERLKSTKPGVRRRAKRLLEKLGR